MASLKLRSLIKLNLKFLLDYEFLRDGRYINVNQGQLHYNGIDDMSILLCDTDASEQFGLVDGQVWQSAFRNWVYESGVVLNDAIGIRNLDLPIICSGVYVSGTFYATDTTHPAYVDHVSHHIDWTRGRIIFDNSINPSSMVQASFSFKHIRLASDRDLNRELSEGYLESQYFTNPLSSNQLVYPSGNMNPFPGVFIEINGRNWRPYELGNRSLIAHDTVTMHIYALDELTFDDIADTLSYQANKSIPMIDFNLAPLPLSGIYHEKSPNYIPYQELIKNLTLTVPESKTGQAHSVGYLMDFNEVETVLDNPIDNFERGRVMFTVRTQHIMPDSPLGINTGAYNFIGGTENF